MGHPKFDRPYRDEGDIEGPPLPSDESLGYHQTTLRVESRTDSTS